MTRLILFLVRRKLGLKKGEWFRFTNQKNKEDKYFITNDEVVKMTRSSNGFIYAKPSNVSLNWLLDPNCEIEKVSQSCSQSCSQS